MILKMQKSMRKKAFVYSIFTECDHIGGLSDLQLGRCYVSLIKRGRNFPHLHCKLPTNNINPLAPNFVYI